MPDQAPPVRDIVLIGAGHTNLHAVREWRKQPLPDARLTLISPFNQATYSGMLPGTLAGLYQPDDMQIDLVRFTAGTEIQLIIAQATGLKLAERLVTFADRAPIPFDIASVGIGSVPSQHAVWQQSPRVLSIKPMSTFLARLEAGVARFRRPDSPLHCGIVGGGAAGTEIAFCLDAWLRRGARQHAAIPVAEAKAARQGGGTVASHRITLLDSHTEVLPGYQAALVRRARNLFAQRGIRLRLGHRVTGIEEGESGPAKLTVTDGTALPIDLVIWSTSASPPEVLGGFELPRTPDGFLAVRATLQTTADAPVFVVGDTASFVDQRVPKAGVYAVREGPILWGNLQRMLAGKPLTEYHPQRGFLSLLNTGDGRALLQYKGWTAYGKWAWYLKDYIDRKFMRLYQDEDE